MSIVNSKVNICEWRRGEFFAAHGNKVHVSSSRLIFTVARRTLELETLTVFVGWVGFRFPYAMLFAYNYIKNSTHLQWSGTLQEYVRDRLMKLEHFTTFHLLAIESKANIWMIIVSAFDFFTHFLFHWLQLIGSLCSYLCLHMIIKIFILIYCYWNTSVSVNFSDWLIKV